VPRCHRRRWATPGDYQRQLATPLDAFTGVLSDLLASDAYGQQTLDGYYHTIVNVPARRPNCMGFCPARTVRPPVPLGTLAEIDALVAGVSHARG